MSKPKRLKTNINQVVWHRQDENDILESINESLKGHEDECHKCLFFDFNDLMNIPKSVQKAFSICLFKIDGSETGSLGFRNQEGLLREFFELTEIAELYPLNKRVIKMEGIQEGNPVNNQAAEKLSNVIVCYFIVNSMTDLYQLKERSGNYIESWDGPKMIRDEIIKLEILLSATNARFSSQLDHLISLQEEEYHMFEVQKDSFRGKLSPHAVSNHLLTLRSFHNKELEEIKNFQDAYTSYIKRHIKKLSIVASEVNILENINKIELCSICGHITRMATDRPSEIPKRLMTKNGSIASMEQSQGVSEGKRDSQAFVPATEATTPTDGTASKLNKNGSAAKRYAHPKVVNMYPENNRFRDNPFTLAEGIKQKVDDMSKSPKESIEKSEKTKPYQRNLVTEFNTSSAKKPQDSIEVRGRKNLNKTLLVEDSIKKTADFGKIPEIPSNSTTTTNKNAEYSSITSDPKPYNFNSPESISKLDSLKLRLDQKAKEVQRDSQKTSLDYKVAPTFNKRDSGLSIAIGSPSFSIGQENIEFKAQNVRHVDSIYGDRKTIPGYSDEFNFKLDDVRARQYAIIDRRGESESNLIFNNNSHNNSFSHPVPPRSENPKKLERSMIESGRKDGEDSSRMNSKDILPFLAKIEATREVLNDLKEERKKKDRVPSQSYLEFLNKSSNKYNERVQHATKPSNSKREPKKIDSPKKREINQYSSITPSEKDAEAIEKPEKSKSVTTNKLKNPPINSPDWGLRDELNEVFDKHENSYSQNKKTQSPTRREKLDAYIKKREAEISLDAKDSKIGPKYTSKFEAKYSSQPSKSVSKTPNILQNTKNLRNIEESLPKLNNLYIQSENNNNVKDQNNLRTILKEIGKEIRDEMKPAKQNKTFEGKGIFDEIKKNWNIKKPLDDKEEIIDPEREAYVNKLIIQKPWLTRNILKPYRLNGLKANFPIDETRKYLTEQEKFEAEREVRFIREKVDPFKEKPRELKTDLEISYDVRYYNKYGDFLLKRVTQKNYYERLDLNKDCSENDIKFAYRAKALIWHPDNCKKNYKSCFANEESYTAVTTEIFALIDEAYRTLSHPEKRSVYDAGLSHFTSNNAGRSSGGQ